MPLLQYAVHCDLYVLSVAAFLPRQIELSRPSLGPSNSRLYLLILTAMIEVFPVWYIDLTFYVLGVRGLICHREFFWLFLCYVILLEGSTLSKTLVEVFVNDIVKLGFY